MRILLYIDSLKIGEEPSDPKESTLYNILGRFLLIDDLLPSTLFLVLMKTV